MKRLQIDSQYTKTYKTVENLNKALVKAGIANERHLLVWTEDNRCTAVFSVTDNISTIVHCGFMVFS